MISVGLELGANNLKIAVVEGGRGGRARLRDFEVHKVDLKRGDTEDDVVSVVENAFKRLKAPRNEVVASVRAQDCMIREILVPFTDEEKIRKTVKYQAESYFSSVAIDDLIIEYSKFAEVDTKSKLLVAGIKKPHVERRLRFLDECSVDPSAIDLDVAALFNTYAHMGVFEDRGAVLLVEIEADTLKVGVVEEGRLRLARAIRMRTNQMSVDAPRKGGGGSGKGAAGSGVYETQGDESARLPVVILDDGDDDEAFSLEDSGISETEREGIIHRVFMEIDRTVASVKLSQEVDLICLTGASCALEGIEDLFAEHFEIEARRVDLAEHFGAGVDKKKKGETSVSLEAATAIGLGLKGLGIDAAGMDFRQEEFVYKGTFEQLKRGLACTLTLLFALVFLYAFGLQQQARAARETVASVKAMQRNLYTVLFPALDDPSRDHQPLTVGAPDGDSYYESLDAERRRLQQKFGGGGRSSGGEVSALQVLRRFAAAKSKVDDQWGLEVMRVRVDPRGAGRSTFECLGNASGAVVALEKALSGDELIEVTNTSTQEDRRSGKWALRIIVELREEGE